MKKATLKLAAFGILMGLAGTTEAQNKINVVTTAVPMLRISPDARATGMGEAGIATSANAYANFWNLGKVPFAKQKTSVGLTYTPWLADLNLKDVYLASVAGYHQLDENQAITLGLRYFSLGNIEFTDVNGVSLGSNKPREFAIEGGYSRKLSKRDGLGIGIRYVSSQLANGVFNGVNYKRGSSVAADLHYFHNGAKENGEGFSYGVTLSNLGSKVAYTDDNNAKDFIPANLGIGGAYTKVFDSENKLTFALDLNKLMVPTLDTGAAALADYRSTGVASSWGKGLFKSVPGSSKLSEITASVGAEYTYKEQFTFRAGYFLEGKDKGNRRYATVGAGLKYNMLGIDLAYIIPSGNGITRVPLSNTIRFGLSFDINSK
jgi:Type IX secretion system protein PorV